MQYSECKKSSGRRFVAAAVQQNDDVMMTINTPKQRAYRFSTDRPGFMWPRFFLRE
ncbi:hypothetical protein BLAT2472_120147 [Burkholderia latens]